MHNTNNKLVGFELANVDIFIIYIGFGLTNVDTIRTLTRHEHDQSTRIATPTNNIIQVTLFIFHIIRKRNDYVALQTAASRV